MKTSGKTIWKLFLACAVFWFFVFFGSAVVMLFNAIAPSMSQYRAGDLGYTILQILSNPIGVALGVVLMRKMTNDEHRTFYIINCTIGATLYVIVVVLSLVSKTAVFIETVSLLLGAVAFVFGFRTKEL